MRTRIKFCGLTCPGDVRLACELGVDALGFVFANQSRRRIDVEQASVLRQAVAPLVDVVALFMDNTTAEVIAAIAALRPTLLQFHGRESDRFCRSFALPFIKTVAMGDGAEAAATEFGAYPSALALLLDGHAPGQAGGHGAVFDWSALPALPGPWILAGGLSPANVERAIRMAKPYAVDVSSAIERAPGLKDGEKMQQFIDEVYRADRSQ